MILLITYTCINPYFPKLSGYKPVLVVEGQITDDNRSYMVKLSYSGEDHDAKFGSVTAANVSVSDETGEITSFSETTPGLYRTDSLHFRGMTGKTYLLHIKIRDGNEYISDSCLMLPVPEIDTIYYERDEQNLHNETVARQGISVFVDSRQGFSDKYFLRWDFGETWKFKVPSPIRYKYINKDTINALPYSQVNEYCFKSNFSTSIITEEVLPGSAGYARKVPVVFISPQETDKLSVRYSMMVNQYSISQVEYNFWNNLKKMNETQGDIFGAQTFPVLGNIRNINDPTEPVLGYFSVSAVTHKRIYINFDEMIHLDLPGFNYNCKRTVTSPDDFRKYNPWGPPMTFDDLYYMYVTSPPWTFVEPVYDQLTGKLFKLVFTSSECSDCRVTGNPKVPDFWTDN